MEASVASRPGHGDLEAQLMQLQPGDHLCCIYRTGDEHKALVTPFLRQGLERGEKTLYIVDAHASREVLGYLESEGIDPAPMLEAGQLVILDADASYLKGGRFDPDGMIGLLREETERALVEGYGALRVTGEMTWALRGREGSDRLMEYEAKLNRFLPSSRCLAICQYDRNRFGAGVLLDVLSTHPIAVIGTEVVENFYYLSPDDFLGPDIEERRLDSWLESLLERKRSDDEIRVIVRVAESAGDALLGVDEEGTVISWNAGAERMYGYTATQAVGRPLSFLYPDDRTSEAADLCALVARGGRILRRETVHRQRDGSIMEVALTLSPLRDRNGRSTGASLVVRDIREQRRQEADRIARIKEELLSLEGLHETGRTRVSAETYGHRDVRTGYPEVFEELVRQFTAAMDLGLREEVYGKREAARDRLIAMAEHLGYLKAGPRDVVEVYTEALRRTSGEEAGPKGRARADQGRLAALELMGHLVSCYRR
jgi:PAS domain S-box-containing protein